jgi:hypothetical protein
MRLVNLTGDPLKERVLNRVSRSFHHGYAQPFLSLFAFLSGRTPIVRSLATHLRPNLNPSETRRFIVLDRGLSRWQSLLEPPAETERNVSERRFRDYGGHSAIVSFKSER